MTVVVGAVDHRSGLERGVSGQIDEWDDDEGMLPTSLPLTDDVFGGGGGQGLTLVHVGAQLEQLQDTFMS